MKKNDQLNTRISVTVCWCSWHGYCLHRLVRWSSVNAQEWNSLYQDHCLQFPDFLMCFLGCCSGLIYLPQLLLVCHWLSHDQRVVLCFLLFQLWLDCVMANMAWGKKMLYVTIGTQRTFSLHKRRHSVKIVGEEKGAESIISLFSYTPIFSRSMGHQKSLFILSWACLLSVVLV